MEYENIIYQGLSFKWSAIRDSEHPDFVLICDAGEIWVQVERTQEIEKMDDRFCEGKTKTPISEELAKKIISGIISGGYLESYFNTDVGLIYSENGVIIEN